MTSTWFRSGLLGPVLILARASGAAAQPAPSTALERLTAVVPAHAKVTVTDTERVHNRLVIAPIVARGGNGVRLTLSF
jgi:hypothetical protein